VISGVPFVSVSIPAVRPSSAWSRPRGEGLSKNQRNCLLEAARVFGLSRETLAKMCRYSVPPGYVRSKDPEKPKLGPLLPVIDSILEADKSAPPKQRHTAQADF
jgi:hypothetical protein